MMTQARAAYLDASIATASPARLLVMLLERLVLDVQRGLDALLDDPAEAHRQLTHAQDIVLELQGSLRAEELNGGHQLAALYGYLHRRLVQANVRKDQEVAAECLTLAGQLRDIWRDAALAAATPISESA
ncbi:MAG: flagellar export chaperone FliS [Nocardioidaceae bacterium]|nr:flagellar export chaperone FliS [Nocardioidaceae bacterium]